uniref:BZip n=1 Tax=Rhizophora mucronata TaxID=61149 RepID=A0A2P2QEW1_RHIMU
MSADLLQNPSFASEMTRKMFRLEKP